MKSKFEKYNFSTLPSRQMTADEIEADEKCPMPKWLGETKDGFKYLCKADTKKQLNEKGYFIAEIYIPEDMLFKNFPPPDFYYIDLLNYAHAEGDSKPDKSLIDFYQGKIRFDELNSTLFEDNEKREALIELAENLMSEAIQVDASKKGIIGKIKTKFMGKNIDKALNYIQEVSEAKVAEINAKKELESQSQQ